MSFDGNYRREEFSDRIEDFGGRRNDYILQQRRSPPSFRQEDSFASRIYDDYAARDSYNNGAYQGDQNFITHESRSESRRSDDFRERDRRPRSRTRSRSPRRIERRGRNDSQDRRRQRSPRVERSRSRSRERRSSRDRFGRDDRRDRPRRRRSREDDWRDDKQELLPPSPTVIIQGLNLDATEEDIEDLLRRDGVSARNVSVIRERNGESRGFGFVDFNDVTSATTWIESKNRQIVVRGTTASLNYSKSKKTVEPYPSDWYCKKCNALNFGSRIRPGDTKFTCFKCRHVQTEFTPFSHAESQKGGNDNSKSSDICKVEPCNVIMLRGMDFSTSEETIRLKIVQLTSKQLYDVRLIRDKVTDMSRGFAFVEFGCKEDAQELLEKIESLDPPFEIDERRITVGYAKHGYNAPLTGRSSGSSRQISKQTVAQNAVAQASAAKATAEYSQSMADSYALSTGASSEQKSQQESQPQQQHQKGQANSNFTYDQSSGYYYDSSTGFYYDSNTGYYFNSSTQQWMYWNGTKYEVVNQDGTSTSNARKAQELATSSQKKAGEGETVPISGQKPKNARKIAKDMERWAKKLNSQSEARKVAVKQAQEELKVLEEKEEELRKKIILERRITGVLSEQAKQAGIRSMFVPDNEEEDSILKLDSALNANTSNKPEVKSLVAYLPNDEDLDVVEESKFIDTAKHACLLCQRQFPSNDKLMKHVQMSQLHKDNLEKLKQGKKVA